MVRPLKASRYGLELVESTFFIVGRTGVKDAPGGLTRDIGNNAVSVAVVTGVTSAMSESNDAIVRPLNASR